MRSSISKGAHAADPREAIKERAREEGFDAVGFARAEAPRDSGEALASYLERGHHGDMAWMETTAARRADPKKLWDAAVSVITLGVSYAPSSDPMDALRRPERGVVSVYAQGD